MQRIALLLLKTAVSIFLLYVAVRGLHPDALLARLRASDLSWAVLAGMMLSLQVGPLGLRWSIIARPLTDRLGVPPAVQMTFISVFFSQVLPSTVGGDAVRIWLLTQRGAGWRAATYSVLIDRVAGVAVLAFIVIACLPWTLRLVHDPLAQSMLLLIGFGVIGASAVFCSFGMLHLNLLERFVIGRHLAEAARVALQLCRTPALAGGIAVSSLCIHALSIMAAWTSARAIGTSIGLLELLFVLPPVLLTSAVPIPTVPSRFVLEFDMAISNDMKL